MIHIHTHTHTHTTATLRVQPYVDLPTGSKQRAVIIRGTFEALETAEREIIELLTHRRQRAADAKAAEDALKAKARGEEIHAHTQAGKGKGKEEGEGEGECGCLCVCVGGCLKYMCV